MWVHVINKNKASLINANAICGKRDETGESIVIALDDECMLKHSVPEGQAELIVEYCAEQIQSGCKLIELHLDAQFEKTKTGIIAQLENVPF